MRKCTDNLQDNAIFIISLDPIWTTEGLSLVQPAVLHAFSNPQDRHVLVGACARLSTDWAATAVSAQDESEQISSSLRRLFASYYPYHESLQMSLLRTNFARVSKAELWHRLLQTLYICRTLVLV
jgi:hypothetical protein